MILRIKSGQYIKELNVELEQYGKLIHIYFGYDIDLINELKTFAGSKWNPDLKCWTFPDNERNRYCLDILKGKKKDISIVPENFNNLKGRFKHQIEGIEFIISRKRCMLAFEMGLGKTLTAIEVMNYLFELAEAETWWLVAPFGALQEWKRQLKKWKCKINFIVATTYESLQKHMEDLPDSFIPDGVIFDETVKIKNRATKRSQTASELCRLVRERNGFIIFLSGAPAPKDPIDWWHQIECIQPGFIREGDPYKFRNRYANIIMAEGEFGKYPKIVSWKEEELKKLGKRLSPIVLCKKKEDCFDYPSKIYEEINAFDLLSVDHKEELMRVAFFLTESATSGILALESLRELSDGFQYGRQNRESSVNQSNIDSNSSMDRINGDIGQENNGFKQENRTTRTNDTNVKIAASKLNNKLNIINPKLSVVQELLDLYHTDNGGPGRLVIYAVYHASIDLLVEFCNKQGSGSAGKWLAFKIDGRGWSNKEILNDFEDASIDNIVVICHPGSVYGLNFSKTYCLCYYSNSFSVDHRIQSIDRRDRPGMDETKGTRIVDILNLPTDKYILDKLKKGIGIQNITLEEIRQCLMK